MAEVKKPVVFISHLTAEKEVAIAFKELIEANFLGMIDVFVSSDGTSIQMGQRWLEEIIGALNACVVQVVVASTVSVERPWINFEAGAAWLRGIPVVPLCHSGMTPSKLPVPLNLLQGSTATEVAGLHAVFNVLAQSLGSQTPKVDFQPFIDRVRAFEEQYTFWDECNRAFGEIVAISPTERSEIISTLRAGGSVTTSIPESVIAGIEKFGPFLAKHQVVRLERLARQFIGTGGVTNGFAIHPLSRMAQVASDPRFKPASRR